MKNHSLKTQSPWKRHVKHRRLAFKIDENGLLKVTEYDKYEIIAGSVTGWLHT
jgi:molecular chaperone DnaK (HSP70)